MVSSNIVALRVFLTVNLIILEVRMKEILLFPVLLEEDQLLAVDLYLDLRGE